MDHPHKEVKNDDKLLTNAVKKAIHRKAPVIKQTLTSMYRIAKANPLIVFKDPSVQDQIDGFGMGNIKLPKSILQPTSNNNKSVLTNTGRNIINSNPKMPITKSKTNKDGQKFEVNPVNFTRTTSLRVNKEISTNKKVQLKRVSSVKVQPSTISKPKDTVQRMHHQKEVLGLTKAKIIKTMTTTTKPANVDKKTTKSVKRRSLSAEHYDRKKRMLKTKTEQFFEAAEITQSLNDVHKQSALATPLHTVISPIFEKNRIVTFKSPSAHNRRSITTAFFTPTPFRKCFASTPGPVPDDLRKRLEDWLRQHNKPVKSYHHLKCFGLNHPRFTIEEEENKENVEGTNIAAAASYEDLGITTTESSVYITPVIKVKAPCTSNFVDNRNVAQDALNDLHKLILDGYEHEQCEAWLGMIRQKYRYLEEEPQYWECRAAIEQTRGNITSAVECLRTAIVQGAEVKAVDHSLEQLLQKFSLLNISTTEREQDNATKKDRVRIMLDARSVFKSSIIQFAVQERILKKNLMQEETPSEKKFIATPVRRSTRNSRSRYTSTPGVQLCASLQELDNTIRDRIDFRINKALHC